MFLDRLLKLIGWNAGLSDFDDPPSQTSLELQIIRLSDKPWGKLGIERVRAQLAHVVSKKFNHRLEFALGQAESIIPICRLDRSGLRLENELPPLKKGLRAWPVQSITSPAYREILETVQMRVQKRMGAAPRAYILELAQHDGESNRFDEIFILQIEIEHLIKNATSQASA